MKKNNFNKIGIICSSNNKESKSQKLQLISKYNFIDFGEVDYPNPSPCDLLIVLGGDGALLHLLHKFKDFKTPIYGINCGTVGFLMNSNKDDQNLIDLISNAKETTLYPLQMNVTDNNGQTHSHYAINEVSLLRQLSMAAKIRIKVNDKIRLESLSCDGVLVSTPAGSTAYNLSLYGPIIPLGSQMLALTPISPFRPRNWHGALLPSNARIEFEILESEQRKVSATADFIEVRNIKKVEIFENRDLSFKILFNNDHSLEEKIIREQFAGY